MRLSVNLNGLHKRLDALEWKRRFAHRVRIVDLRYEPMPVDAHVVFIKRSTPGQHPDGNTVNIGCPQRFTSIANLEDNNAEPETH